MRVAMYYNNKDILIEDMPVPQIGPEEILMKVEASGICGSDVLEWYRIKKAPLVLGHEVAGRVEMVGKEVDKFNIGDRIVSSHHVPCNTCFYCLSGHHTACNTLRSTNFDPGGFSEYIRLPSINVDRGTFIIPDEVSYEEATFHEPLGCVIRAQRIARLRPGQCVLVIGSGIAGLLNIHLARASGAGRILAVDIVPYRINAAEKFGADKAVNASENINDCLRNMNSERLADIVIVCTGARQAQIQALKSVERGGTVLFFAPTEPDVKIPLSINDVFFRNDITLATSYGAGPYDSWLALELIRSSLINIKEMITHRLPLEEILYGFKL
ncbi:MAG: alcohol dehydrogenase catalytic domain-containing protein, partial [Acidobacteriota bacterium]|nr:alcohol dehydrogenase catalytic domain-containing protein [Acidobacteriota bacterium]